MKTRNLLIALPACLLAIAAVASGNHSGGHHEDDIGKAGVAARATRTVTVEMSDAMRFNPSSIAVKRGETIRFVVKNSGKLKHELVLGTQKELKEHNEVMKKNPEMEHADANMLTVAPGQSGELIWQFTKAGKVDFACLQPGHYDAGMKGSVTVAGVATALSADAPYAQSSTSTAIAGASAADMTEGEVRKVDKENMKITLKHGEIKNLEMPGMTMVFTVNDATMLDKVKAGDKVLFKAAKEAGKIVVTEIQPAR